MTTGNDGHLRLALLTLNNGSMFKPRNYRVKAGILGLSFLTPGFDRGRTVYKPAHAAATYKATALSACRNTHGTRIGLYSHSLFSRRQNAPHFTVTLFARLRGLSGS